MRQKFYILYKTTNIKNNKFYIGVHETFNLEDGYLGSGKRFKNSLYYHGKENFKREILEYFDNSKSMYNREQEIVNEELLKNSKCLNIGIGGIGGFINKEHMKKCSKAGNKAFKLKIKEDLNFKNTFINLGLELYKKNTKSGNLFGKKRKFDWIDKSHSQETKEKMRKPKNVGKNNSQFGTKWITNGIVNKKIKKEESLPNYFKFGRI